MERGLKQHWMLVWSGALLVLASEWDCPSPEPHSSVPEAGCGRKTDYKSSISPRLPSHASESPFEVCGTVNPVVTVKSSSNVTNPSERKAAISPLKKLPSVCKKKKEQASLVQAPTTWRVLGSIDGARGNVTERVFEGKKVVEVEEIDIPSNYSEVRLQNEISDDQARQSTVIKGFDGARKTLKEVRYCRSQVDDTILYGNLSHNSNSLVVTSTYSNPKESPISSFVLRDECDTCRDDESHLQRNRVPIAAGSKIHESGRSPASQLSTSSTLSDLIYINKLKVSMKSQVKRPADRESQPCTSFSGPETSVGKGVKIKMKPDTASTSNSEQFEGEVTTKEKAPKPEEAIDVMSNVSRKFITFSKVNAGASCSTDVADKEPSASVAAKITDHYLREANKKILIPKILIKRPPNQFLLFSRSVRSSVAAQHPDEPSSAISARIAAIWKTLPENEKSEWARRAQEAREEHERQYPGFKFPTQVWRYQKLLYRIEKEMKRSIFSVSPRK
ncbi:High mobility group box domain [Trinorchestia longiramus]|nr:High mobility group box domain [Trinorchestia longiramus]